MTEINPELSAQRPLVSFMILCYKQADYIRDAIQSALDQDYSPLEIIVSDDCSPDDTYQVAADLLKDYKGKHQVTLRRTSQNLGITAHVTEVMAMTTGVLVIGNGGDDISLPQRTRVTVDAWLAAGGKPDLVACPVIDMDQTGNCHDTLPVSDLARYKNMEDWARSRPHVIGAGMAWSRNLIQTSAPMPEKLTHEDQLAVVRAILRNGGITLDQPLVKYRRGGISQKTTASDSAQIRKRMLFDARNDWLFFTLVLNESGSEMPITDQKRFRKLAFRARHLLDLEHAGVFRTTYLTLFSSHADLGFRLRALVHLRAPAYIAWLNKLKQSRRQR